MTPLLLQLYALRAQLEAVIMTVEQGDGFQEPAPPPTEGCPHRPERQRDGSTFGGPPTVVCLDCGERRLGTVQ